MKGEKKFSILLLLISVLFLIGSLFIVDFKNLTITSPGGYPILISVVTVLCALYVVFVKNKNLTDPDDARSVFDPTIIAFIIMLILYVVLINIIHYTLATLIFLFAAMVYLERKNWRRAILVSYISTFMILLVFKYIFSVIMP